MTASLPLPLYKEACPPVQKFPACTYAQGIIFNGFDGHMRKLWFKGDRLCVSAGGSKKSPQALLSIFFLKTGDFFKREIDGSTFALDCRLRQHNTPTQLVLTMQTAAYSVPMRAEHAGVGAVSA